MTATATPTAAAIAAKVMRFVARVCVIIADVLEGAAAPAELGEIEALDARLAANDGLADEALRRRFGR